MDKRIISILIFLSIVITQVFSQQSDDVPNTNVPVTGNKGSIKIITEPPGVTCLINGKEYGKSPIIISDLNFGKYILRLEKSGYLMKEMLITINSNQVQDVNAKLDGISFLTINVQPQNAKIIINKKEVGTGSVTKMKVKSGDIHIQFKAPGYEDFEQILTIEPTKHKAISGKMVSQFGTLALNSKPTKASIYLNEKKIGVTPFKSKKIDPGEYELKLYLKNHKEVIENIAILKNKTISKEFILEPLKEYAEDKKNRKERFKWIRRIAFGSLALGFGAAGIYYNNEVKIYYDKYNDYKSYNSVIHDENWDKVEENKKTRNIMYSLSGCCVALFVISVPF